MTLVTRIQEQLEGIDIRFKEPLKLYTYTKVGDERIIWFCHAIAMRWRVSFNLPIKRVFLGWC